MLYFFTQVMVIQARQNMSPTKHGHPVHSPPMLTTSAQLSDPGIVSDPATPSQVLHNYKHIILTKPHTTLLLATVTGGKPDDRPSQVPSLRK